MESSVVETREKDRLMHLKSRLSLLMRFGVATCMAICIVTANLGCVVATRHPTISQEDVAKERLAQTHHAEQQLAKGTRRVVDAAWPILIGNTELCGKDVEYRTGIWIAHKSHIVHSMFGFGKDSKTTIGKEAVVWAVAQNSPADLAGIKSGDFVQQVSGKPVDGSDHARKQMRRAASLGSSMTLSVQRASKVLKFDLVPISTCRSDVRVVSDSFVNASANGRTITIYNGLLEVLQDKRDLQVVFAHELAHNVAKHIPQAVARATVGGIMDIALAKFGRVWAGGIFTRLGAISFSKRYEREADYLGMYYLANADVELDGVEEVWRRLGALDARFIGFGLTHPSTPERFVTMRKTRDEIESKRRQGKPLRPEKR